MARRDLDDWELMAEASATCGAKEQEGKLMPAAPGRRAVQPMEKP